MANTLLEWNELPADEQAYRILFDDYARGEQEREMANAATPNPHQPADGTTGPTPGPARQHW